MKGYTLFELVIVLLILAALTSLTYLPIKRIVYRGDIISRGQKIKNELEKERIEAMVEGEPTEHFYPDGSSDGETIEVSNDCFTYTIDISPVCGIISSRISNCE